MGPALAGGVRGAKGEAGALGEGKGKWARGGKAGGRERRMTKDAPGTQGRAAKDIRRAA